MALNYHFIGWCKENNHDKVWGAIVIRNGLHDWSDKTYLTFWGRRGKKLQTRIITTSSYDIEKLERSKRNKGYNSINKDSLDTVYPEFENDLSKTAMWASLKF